MGRVLQHHPEGAYFTPKDRYRLID